MKSLTGWLVVGCLAGVIGGTGRADVFVNNIGGPLYQINKDTAATIDTLVLPGNRQWNDIGSTPLDPTGIYAVSLDQQTAARRLTRIDTATGTVTDLTMTRGSGLSINPLSYGWWGVTFDPRQPDVGYVALTVGTSNGGQRDGIARFNLSTLQFDHAVLTTHRWSSLAMSNTGQLIGSVDFFDISRGKVGNGNASLYSIDPITGNSTLLTTTNIKDITGLAFAPGNNQLYAINAFSTDSLIAINSLNGFASQTVGALSFNGPNGLAFTHDPLLSGDANADGRVDAADFVAVEQNFGRIVAPGWFLLGDANHDQRVDGNDLLAVEQAYGDGVPDMTTPEPTTCMLVMSMSCVGLLTRARPGIFTI